MLKKAVFALVFFLLFRSALALDYFGIDSSIVDTSANMQITILSKEEEIGFKFFGNIINFTSNALCNVQGNSVSCKKANTTTITIKFKSNIIQTNGSTYRFYQQFLLPNVGRVTSLVTLPVGHVIANVSDAVYPEKYSMLSNGRNILVYWEFTNVSSLQPLAFQVYYQPLETEKKPVYTSIYLILVLLVAFTSLSVLLGLRKREKIKGIVKSEKVVLRVLDEYERKVFEVVKKSGRIKQNKIVEETGISKAKVSRVVRSLESKGLLKTERRGRTKFVMLNKKVF